eukprot:361479-Pelagomonas_calceolata.AAC.1
MSFGLMTCRKVTTLLSLSRGFKTLRDQYAENTILPDELQPIKSLGEGKPNAKHYLMHASLYKQLPSFLN